MKKVKIIATLGPVTNTEQAIRKIKDKHVDFIRINMSHSSLEDLQHFITLSKKVGIPFIIDTEGSQVRTGDLAQGTIELKENDLVRLYSEPIVGNEKQISLRPSEIISQLNRGDLIHIDFDTATLRVSDTSTASEGYITAKAVTTGKIGKNKAVILDQAGHDKITLPPLSPKDYKAIELGIHEQIGHIAVSFVRSGKCIDEVRRATQNTMQIISKIECVDALENLDEIIKKSDYLLIDRGDLSKEIPVEKIPFTQKIILNKAKKHNVGVFVATNLLESMIENRKPTRAEVHDIINTIVDGAYGLVLAAETAVGKYPMETVNMLNKVITHSDLAIDISQFSTKEDEFVQNLIASNYLLDFDISSALISPHGGRLVDRMVKKTPSEDELSSLQKVPLTPEHYMDLEQISIGTYSPIEGYMNKTDFNSVLDRMKLADGTIWPIPITLDVSEHDASEIHIGQFVVLTFQDEPVGLLQVEDKFLLDKDQTSTKLFGTIDETHPGVEHVNKLNPYLLGGKVTLLKRKDSPHKEYELTPRQVRRLFDERGWAKVVGFHTRNVIHKSHEFIQLEALEKENCDGLFVHPVIGKKKPGDFNEKFIIKSYEIMAEQVYPKNKVLFSTFSTFSRYAGPREALFTALCRKNFGCSHFIVGRDHTGVGSWYHPKASHNIFDRFKEIGITPVKFDVVSYSNELKDYVHGPSEGNLHISGTEARLMLEQEKQPPEWFMREEISQMIIEAIQRGEEVFVNGKSPKAKILE